MYAWFWRRLPGPVPVRLLMATVLLIAVVAVLFTWVFPLIAPLMPFNQADVTRSG